MKTRFDKKITIDGYHVVKYLILAPRIYFTFWGSSRYQPVLIISTDKNKKFFSVSPLGFNNAFKKAIEYALDIGMLTEDAADKINKPTLETLLRYRQYYTKNFGNLVPRSDIYEMFGVCAPREPCKVW